MLIDFKSGAIDLYVVTSKHFDICKNEFIMPVWRMRIGRMVYSSDKSAHKIPRLKFNGSCTCQHKHDQHSYAWCEVKGCDCKAHWGY